MHTFRARVSSKNERLWLLSEPLTQIDDGWMLEPSMLGDISALSLDRALSRLWAHDSALPPWEGINPATGMQILIDRGPAQFDVYVSQVEGHDHDDVWLPEPVRFCCRGDGLTLRIDLPAIEPGDDEAACVGRLVAPLCELIGVTWRLTTEGSLTGWAELELVPECRFRSLAQIYDLGWRVLRLIRASDGGQMLPETVHDLARSGAADLLVGQPETEWLDVKRTAPNGRFEFAKDVAAFANTGRGGLLIYGLSTKKDKNGDRISGLRPLPKGAMRPAQLVGFLTDLLRPRPSGVEINVVSTGSGFVGVVYVPPQDQTRLPILVAGSTVDGKVRENFIGIPVRFGEHTYWEDAATIHSLIAAGRVALNSAASS